MSGKEILSRVRRAIHLADSLHTGNTALAEQLLSAAEHCRQANREFLNALEKLRPTTAAGEQARSELLQQLNEIDCGDKLLSCMLEADTVLQADIHTHTPPEQLQ